MSFPEIVFVEQVYNLDLIPMESYIRDLLNMCVYDQSKLSAN